MRRRSRIGSSSSLTGAEWPGATSIPCGAAPERTPARWKTSSSRFSSGGPVPRELSLALRARVTWLVAAVSALLVGHGFVLAVDIFSASSRSAAVSALQAREMDPLAGVVRPTLGGVDLATVLLGPLVAARTLSMEKERRTFGPLCLAER